MECIHLEECVDISPAFVSRVISQNTNLWKCAECKTNKSPWMCLKCGKVLCGRYVKGHAKEHGESDNRHSVCIDASLMLFCYRCDDFVINDTSTGDIQMIRTALQTELPRVRKRRSRLSADQKLQKDNSPNKKFSRSNSKESQQVTKLYSAVGLRNLGNTCFMNAILQSLSNLKHFTAYFKDMPAIELNGEVNDQKKKYYTRSYQSDDISLVEELRKVLCALCQGSGGVAISPESLFTVVWKVVPRFRGYQQQDAHEFMHCLLDRVHEELLPSHSDRHKNTIVTGLFRGHMRSEVTCLTCRTVSTTEEPYWDLSLDIPIKTKHKQVSSSPPKKKQAVCQLSDCLQRFIEEERLEQSEWYHCENCKCKQPSTKKFWLLRIPNVLCLHLKRFRYNAHGRTKVDTFVRFPVTDLNMEPFLLKTSQKKSSHRAHTYDLAACVLHHGGGAGSGHYTTYARHNGSWYNFNDSTVSELCEDSLHHCKAYILFYTRQYPDVSVIDRIKSQLAS